ncbi:porin [Pandoraea communis]|uniref:Porin n=1 Tax=Pandoraea communis TaxID=2508297 RepID=A0A5E4X5M7_9BURK|nr:porin [Pandoraea communis]MDM8358229.1 porin [Pandoraea communis]VVE31647.1 porin [Pandoraea communis]
MKPNFRIAAAGCCLAFASSLPMPALAQSNVQLYGLIDSGVEFLTNADKNAAGNTVNLTRITSGNLAGSRWGIKGTEDLGGGNKALFLIESGFNLGNGQSLQGGREFGRLAYVGLSNSSFGTVTIGRQGGVFLDWVSKFNPLNNAVYAIKMQDTAFSDRLDNSLRYTARLGAFEGMVQYSKGYDDVSFGGAKPGDNRRAQVVDAGMRYANGPLSFVLAYDQKNGGSTLPNAAMTPKVGGYEGNIDRRIAAAVRYSLQNVDLYVGYRYLNAKAIHLSALNKSPVEASSYYWLGTKWHAMPALDLSATAMYQDFYGTNRDPLSFQVSADYNFSKRTDAYVNLGYVVNRNGSDLGLNGFGNNVVAGKNQFGTMAGIKHTF